MRRPLVALLTLLSAACVPHGTTHQQWAALRNCESGGNYQAVSRSGKYRGAYQADRSFWLTYGGDPSYARPARWEMAPTAMQDAVAFAGYRARGARPWPVCGRFL